MAGLLKKLPLPITGLMLGLAALGNLIGPYNMSIRYVFGILAGLIGLLVIIKVIMMPGSIITGFDNPVVASVMGTFPMALMILSTYIKPLQAGMALGLWSFAVLLHLVLILAFTMKYIVNFNIKKVFPSYFIVYVGIVVLSVTSPAYQLQVLGQYAFWFGFVSYLILLPIVTYRVIKHNDMPKPARPTLIIFSAPASLCLVGYLKAFSDKQAGLIYLLATLSIIMLLYAVYQLIKLIKLPFMPSYSAFTFPLVISAIALTGFNAFVGGHQLLSLAKNATSLLAGLMVIYVLIRYTVFLVKQEELKPPQKKAV